MEREALRAMRPSCKLVIRRNACKHSSAPLFLLINIGERRGGEGRQGNVARGNNTGVKQHKAQLKAVIENVIGLRGLYFVANKSIGFFIT